MAPQLLLNFHTWVQHMTFSEIALWQDGTWYLQERRSHIQQGKGRGTLQSYGSVQFSSVAQSCQTLCNPMNRSTPGLPVHLQIPEFTQTHVHWVGDAIQPSHPLSSPSPPARNPSQHQCLFQWVSSLHQVTKVLEFQLQHQFFQWTRRTDLLYDGLAGSPCRPRDSQESFPTPQFKSINSSVLSFLYSLTLTSMHDYWKNHSLDEMDLCWQSNVSAFLICCQGWS